MTELKNGGERKVLDLTKAIYVDLPELDRPDFEERKPQEYWNYFNNGMELYKKKRYYEAKKEFLKVLSYPNPHNTFRTYLLRTYRKIVTLEIKDEKFNEAYLTFKEFFNNCTDDITNTDIRKYNKLMGTLLKINPEFNYEKKEIIEVPEFEIEGSKKDIELINQNKFNKDTDPRIKNWNYLAFINSKTLYLGQLYNNELSRYNQTFFKVKNTEGKIEKEFDSDHLFYRFNYSETSDKFVWSSDDLVFYLYSIEIGFIKSLSLTPYSEHKYHLRCVNISPEGNFLLFTNINKAYLMNSEFEIINSWSTPHKDGLEKRVVGSSIDRTKIDQNLSVLGLSGNPDKDEIKNAFKKLVIKYHPDQNPSDIGANNKIREIINAYEYLTNENAENVFRESERVEYYSYIQRTKVNIPNTNLSFDIEIGITAPPEDWIYAAYLGSEAKKIYLGCYSGKVYCLSREGNVKTVYNCHDVIKSIKEKQNYLLIETDYYLHVLKDNKYINHLETGRGSILWMDNVFLIKNTNELRIYSY